MSGNKPNSTGIKRRSRRMLPAIQRAQTAAQQGQAQMAGQSLMPTLETAGPNNIEVQQFGGFGPMGNAPLGGLVSSDTTRGKCERS